MGNDVTLSGSRPPRRKAPFRSFGPRPLALGSSEGKPVVAIKLDSSENNCRPQAIWGLLDSFTQDLLQRYLEGRNRLTLLW